MMLICYQPESGGSIIFSRPTIARFGITKRCVGNRILLYQRREMPGHDAFKIGPIARRGNTGRGIGGRFGGIR